MEGDGLPVPGPGRWQLGIALAQLLVLQRRPQRRPRALSWIGSGVPAGAYRACQVLIAMPGKPASAVVGTSGAGSRAGCHAIGAHPVVADEGHGVGRLVAEQVDAPGHQLGDRRAGAAEHHVVAWAAAACCTSIAQRCAAEPSPACARFSLSPPSRRAAICRQVARREVRAWRPASSRHRRPGRAARSSPARCRAASGTAWRWRRSRYC